MLNPIILVTIYALLGAGGKYIDQAYDLGVFNKKKAVIVSIICATIISYLIVKDPSSAMIFLSLIIGVAISKKIDNIAFYIGTIIVILLPITFGGWTEIQWIPFSTLTISAILDEVGNDWADKTKNKRLLKTKQETQNKKRNKLIEKFFKYRCAMKLTILVLSLLSFLNIIYFIAFMLFDTTYTLVGKYSEKIKVYSIKKELPQTT